MEQNMNPSSEGDNPTGGRAQERANRFENASRLYHGAQKISPVQALPYQVQMSTRTDRSGRGYMVLENVPDRNYVANAINSGGEFAIGGTASFIGEALDSELSWRVYKDAKNQSTQSLWHVIVLPDSNMSDAPRFDAYDISPETLKWPPATTLRPIPTNLSHGPPAVLSQQNSYTNQQPLLPQANVGAHQQPMLVQNTPMSGFGQGSSSVVPSQWSQSSTSMPGNFQSRGGSTMALPQQQLYSQTPTQGNFQGPSLNSGAALGSFQGQGQGNNTMFNQSSGPHMGALPQAHRPIFDKNGYIVGEEGSNYGSKLYESKIFCRNMGIVPKSVPYRGPQQQLHPPPHPQNAVTGDPQLTAQAQSFFAFVQQKMDEEEKSQSGGGQGECNQSERIEGGFEQDDRDQDEGVALGNNSGTSGTNISSQQAAPHQSAPPPLPQNSNTELLLASEEEPHRFGDLTGINYCDYCDRDGHEAAECIKWDVFHYDKPVCTACNNKQHSLDECLKFSAMSFAERQALLIGKGARRPGVRSKYHSWTSYVPRGPAQSAAGSGGYPLTRLFLRDLWTDDKTAMLQNMWKVWDYGRGVPDQLRDPRAESLAGDPAVYLDERFVGDQEPAPKQLIPTSSSSIPTSSSSVPQKRPWDQSSLPQAENATEGEGYEAELWNSLT